MRCRSVTFLLSVLSFAGLLRAEDWSRYDGFNEMPLGQQRDLVARDLREMRSRFEGMNFRGELEVSVQETVSSDPFGNDPSPAAPHQGRHTVEFVTAPGRIKVDGFSLSNEGGRVREDRHVFTFNGQVACTMFHREDKPTQLTVKDPPDITIYREGKSTHLTSKHPSDSRISGLIMYPFLWVTNAELAPLSSLSIRHQDDLAQAIQDASEFELQELTDRPDQVVVSYHGERIHREHVFELAQNFRWIRSAYTKRVPASTKYVTEGNDEGNQKLDLKSSRIIEYGRMTGLEVPVSWTVAHWYEWVRPNQPPEVIPSSLRERQGMLKTLDTPDEIPSSEFLLEPPEIPRKAFGP